MELTLHQDDSLRVSTRQRNIFVDVRSTEMEAAIEVFIAPILHYVELREKNDTLKLFVFKSKGEKKHHDFGVWTDAKVVYSKNIVMHEK